MTKQAKPVADAIEVAQAIEHGGIGFVYVAISADDPAGDFRKLPAALEYEARLYGKSAFDSDRLIAVYRTDRAVARVRTARGARPIVCGGCSGRAGALVQEGGGAQLYRCDGCGGLIGRAARHTLATFVKIHEPMLPNTTEGRYFDVDVVDAYGDSVGRRLHGWYDVASGRVVQWG